jgi:hypothetical protein
VDINLSGNLKNVNRIGSIIGIDVENVGMFSITRPQKFKIREFKMGISFDDFWTAYPRKVGKIDAEKAYTKALTRSTVANILQAAQKFAANCCGKDTQFIPHPATWLNRGSWDDAPVDEKIIGLWFGPKPKWPPDNQRGRPGHVPRDNWANLYIGSEAPQYRKMIARANKPETDKREFRYDEGRGGIWVSQKWIWG